MRVSTLNTLAPGDIELGVVYASGEGVNEKSYDECIEQLTHKAQALGAIALVALQLVQSQFQWNQRTSPLATAVKEAESSARASGGMSPIARNMPLPSWSGTRVRRARPRARSRRATCRCLRRCAPPSVLIPSERDVL